MANGLHLFWVNRCGGTSCQETVAEQSCSDYDGQEEKKGGASRP